MSDTDKEQVKSSVVDLMVVVPTAVQKQISETLSIISESDFPSKWPNLLPVGSPLRTHSVPNSPQVITVVLQHE